MKFLLPKLLGRIQFGTGHLFFGPFCGLLDVTTKTSYSTASGQHADQNNDSNGFHLANSWLWVLTVCTPLSKILAIPLKPTVAKIKPKMVPKINDFMMHTPRG